MKKILLICFLFAVSFGLHAKAVQEESALAENKARTSYAFGMIIGSQLLESGIELDLRAFSEGLKTSLEKEPQKMSSQEAYELVDTAFNNAADKQNDASRLAEMQFLEQNMARPGVFCTESGLQYEPLTKTDGEKPLSRDIVQVYYEGKLVNGTIFDSRSSPEEPLELPLDAVISGWSEGLQLMSPGSIYRLYIPSDLAYGAMGAGGIIKPYSTLIFKVELLKIIKTENFTD